MFTRHTLLATLFAILAPVQSLAGIIGGTVTAPGGAPIQGVSVQVARSLGEWWNYDPVTTDSDGRYAVADIPAGEYKVWFSGYDGGYIAQWYPDSPTKEGAAVVTITADEQVTVNAVLTPGGRISGRVTSADAIPLWRIWVNAFDITGETLIRSTRTDGFGDYSLGSLPSGDYLLSFQSSTPGFLGEWFDDQPSSQTAIPIHVNAPETLAGKNAALAMTGGGVSGTITGTDGTPLVGVGVSVYGSNGDWIDESQSSPLGTFVFGGLAAGGYRIHLDGRQAGHLSEWYRDKSSYDSADLVQVSDGAITRGIDPILALGAAIRGTVSDTEGAPIAGVEVQVYDQDYNWMGYSSTNEAGAYSVGGLETGSYKVRLGGSASGFIDEWYADQADFSSASLVEISAPQVATADAVLARGGRIAGTVADASGTPLRNVEVNVYDLAGEGRASAYTDDLGQYRVQGLASGSYKVKFVGRYVGYLDEWYEDSADIATAASVVVTAPDTATVNASLLRGGSISGTVRGPEGNPVAWLTIYLYDQNQVYLRDTYTEDDGSFSFSGLTSGSYKIFINGSESGYYNEWYNDKADSASADLVVVTPPNNTGGIDTVLSQGGVITGTVTDVDGNPISALVEIESDEDYRGDFTNEAGVYRFTRLASGSYKIHFDAAASGFQPEWYNDKADWSSADPVVVAAPGTVTANAVLTRGGSITGTVTDPDGNPIQNVYVYAYDPVYTHKSSGRTGANGLYVLGGLPSGSYKVFYEGGVAGFISEWHADKSDFSTADQIAVAAQAAVTVDAVLSRGGTIAGAVTDNAGNPILDVQVSVYDLNNDWKGTAFTASDGRYSVGGLSFGSYKIQFQGSGVGYLNEWNADKDSISTADPVDIVPPATTTVNAVLMRGGSVAGTISDVDGNPIAGVDVNVFNADQVSFGYSITAADGTYSVGGLPSGTYRILFNGSRSGYLTEWYADKGDFASGDAVEIVALATTTANAVLSRAATIVGTVVNDQGLAVEGLQVQLWSENDYGPRFSTSTNSSGYYEFRGLASGGYRVFFAGASAGYQDQWHFNKSSMSSADIVEVIPPGTTTVNAVVIHGGRVAGTVTDPAGNPIAGAWVLLYRAPVNYYEYSWSATSAAGAYEFTGLAAGSYLVAFSGESLGYIGEWYADRKDAATADLVEVVPPATTTADAVLELGGRVAGTVTDVDGNPIAGAVAWLLDMSGSGPGRTTSADGTYEFLGVASGNYKVRFEAAGYLEEWYADKSDLASADEVAVLAPATTTVDAALSRGGSIVGTVVDDQGDPVSGLSVTAVVDDYYWLSTTVQTDNTGAYEIRGLSPGSYRVFFFGAGLGYISKWHPDLVVVAATGATTVDAVLSLGGKVIGTVADIDANPLSGVIVWLYDLTGNGSAQTTGPAGTYEFVGLASGSHKLFFSGRTLGFLDEWHQDRQDHSSADIVEVIAPAATMVDAVLAPGGRIIGTVVDTQGVPVVGLQVQLWPDGASWSDYYATTNSSGSYEFRGLASGSYRVFLVGASLGYGNQWHSDKPDMSSADIVEVIAPETATVNAVLSPGGRVAGIVADADGKPIGGAAVWLYDSSSTRTGRTTSASGTYEFMGLSSGNYRVMFQAAGYSTEWHSNKGDYASADSIVVTAPATTTIDATLMNGGNIDGTITDESGTPLDGVEVRIYEVTSYFYDGYANHIAAAVSGNGGAFRVSGLAGGAYLLYFCGSQIKPEWYRDAESSSTATLVPVYPGQSTSGVDPVLTFLGTISGTVVDSIGNRLGGVGVSIHSAADMSVGYVETDALGNYRIDVEPGAYRVRFSKTTYVPGWYGSSADYASARDVQVTLRQTAGGIDYQLVRHGTVAGRVTDTGGNPLEGVSVYAYDISVGQYETYCPHATTDPDGQYEFSELVADQIKIKFTHTDYLEEWHSNSQNWESADVVTVPNETRVANIDAQLSRGAVITGSVSDNAGAAIAGVNVYAYRADDGSWARSTTSKADGRYLLGGMPDGSYRIRFEHAEYVAEWYDDAIYFTTAAVITASAAQPAAGVDARLERFGRIAGQVTDAFAVPLAEATVELWQDSDRVTSTWTDAGGMYLFSSLVPGNYQVRFIMQDYNEQWFAGRMDRAAADVITLAYGQSVEGVDAQLVMLATIAGRVSDYTGNPAPGVTVCAYSSANSCAKSDSTDSNGNYRIVGLSPGTYKIKFSGGGYYEKWHNDTYNYSLAEILTIVDREQITGIDARLSAWGRISGRVVDRYGHPVSGATVYAHDGSNAHAYATTGNDGSYLSDPMPYGYYRVRFSKAGCATEWFADSVDGSLATTLLVSGGTTGGINAQLLIGGTVRGNVRDLEGRPLSGVTVEAYAVPGNIRVGQAWTTANGAYAIRNLLPGDYKLKYSGDGVIGEYYEDQNDLPSATILHVADESETTGIDAQLLTKGGVAGRLTDEGGNPIAGVEVQAYLTSNSWYPRYAYTDSNGEYRLLSMSSGSYQIRFQSSAFFSEWYNDKPDRSGSDLVEVVNGQMTLGIDARLTLGGSVYGTVTDQASRPIAYAAVVIYSSTGSEVSRTTSNAQGAYRVAGLPAGGYKVYFTANDHLAEWSHDKPDVTAADVIAVSLGQATEVNAQLSRGGVIVGTIINSSGAPIQGCQLYLYSAEGDYLRNTYADGWGLYRFTGLQNGDFKISVPQCQQYLQEWYDGKDNLASADPISVTAGQSTEAVVHLARGGILSGKVTNSTGEPIPGVQVRLYNASGNYVASESTGSTGVYRIDGLAPGEYRIQYYATGTAYLSEWHSDKQDLASATPVSVSAEQETGIDAQLTLGGSIAGRITGEAGNPLEDVDVRLYDIIGSQRRVVSSAIDGTYSITGIDAGTYTLFFDTQNSYYAVRNYRGEWYDDRSDRTQADALTISPAHLSIVADAMLTLDTPPTLAVVGDRVVAEGALLEIQLSASDPDGDALQYRMSGTMSGASLNSTTGLFAWRPRCNQAGTYTVTFTADDGRRSDSRTISITVTESNAPDLAVTSIALPAEAWTTLSFNVSWTLENGGTAPVAGTWVDRVYLSTDDVPGGDTLLGEFPSSSLLGVREQMVRVQTVSIPRQGTVEGAYRIIVVTDATAAVCEDPGESNNTMVSGDTLMVHLNPLPDLLVTSITAPPEAWTTRGFDISWTLENRGAAAVSGAWVDRVYLSADEEPGGDILLGEFPSGSPLEVGERLARTQTLSIPRQGIVEGAYRIIVVTDATRTVYEDAGESNNTLVSQQPITVFLNPIPDLIVASVEAPASAWSDQTVTVSWTTSNTGAGSTDTPTWHDRIYLSTDSDFDATDIPGSAVQNASYLAPGESYTSTGSVMVPVGSSGIYYVIVVADNGGHVLEQDESNNAGYRAISIQLTPPPDLQVDAVGGPDTAWSGQSMAVTWTVSNRGTRAVPDSQSSWDDSIYLSADTTLDQQDTLLGNQWHHGALSADGTYTVNAQLHLPTGITGDFYIFVVTDASHRVYEHAAENNNRGFRALPTHINLSPPPDLQLSFVVLPEAGIAGQSLQVSWTVTNEGSGETVPPAWNDALYLSEDDVLQTDQDKGVLVSWHSGALAGSESYTQNLQVPLSACQVGSYYLFVVTDRDRSVFEFAPGHDAEANNSGRSPGKVTVVSTPPDLRVSEVITPASGVAGQPVDISWAVTNTGATATGTASWHDKIYLSHGPPSGAHDFMQLGQFLHQGALEAGGSYTQTERVMLPVNAAGTYYLYVVADAEDNVEECSSEGNNSGWGVASFQVESRPPDLVASALQCPPEADSGRALTISWSVANNGVGPTIEPRWEDAVFLSTNTDFNADADMRVAAMLHEGPLGAGGSYQVTVSPRLPQALNGSFYVFACADAGKAVFEGTGEGNNCIRSVNPLQVNLSPAPDLVVEAVDAPASTFSGQAADVSWSVVNQGAVATESGGWTDYLYLSRDQILDPTDPQIGYRQHAGALGVGEQYADTLTVDLPRGISGPYYVFVRTDRNDTVWESDEQNNAGRDAAAMLVELPPPADLFVESVNVPTEAVPGREVDFSWRVGNNGPNVATGGWVDSVYLSADQVWDIRDTLVGRSTHHESLGASAVYDASVRARVPGVVPGAYYVIVRTDIGNSVRETDETNNIGVSNGTIAPDATEIQLGSPVSATLTQGAEHYYKVHVSAGEDLRIALDSAATDGANELFVRFGAMPDAAHFDYIYDAPFMPDQEITVPTTSEGWYFILVRGVQVPNPPVGYTLDARVLEFSIQRVAPGRIGNAGDATLRIDGAEFGAGVTAFLRDESGNEVQATRVTVVDTSRLFATFKMVGSPTGRYQLRLENGTGIAAGDAAIEVAEGLGAKLAFEITVPAMARPGAGVLAWVDYANVGDADMVPLPVSAANSQHRPMSFQPGSSSGRDHLEFMTLGDVEGSLRPGAGGRIPLYLMGVGEGEVKIGLYPLCQPGDPISWIESPEGLRPREQGSWMAYIDALRPRWGTSCETMSLALATTAQASVSKVGLANAYAVAVNAHVMAALLAAPPTPEPPVQSPEAVRMASESGTPDSTRVFINPGQDNQGSFDDRLYTKIVFHGWNNSMCFDDQANDDCSRGRDHCSEFGKYLLEEWQRLGRSLNDPPPEFNLLVVRAPKLDTGVCDVSWQHPIPDCGGPLMTAVGRVVEVAQEVAEWVQANVPQLDMSKTIVVGHSLGAGAGARFADMMRTRGKGKARMMVGLDPARVLIPLPDLTEAGDDSWWIWSSSASVVDRGDSWRIANGPVVDPVKAMRLRALDVAPECEVQTTRWTTVENPICSHHYSKHYYLDHMYEIDWPTGYEPLASTYDPTTGQTTVGVNNSTMGDVVEFPTDVLYRAWLFGRQWSSSLSVDPQWEQFERHARLHALAHFRVVRSSDPNEKQGPAGYGDNRAVSAVKTLPYEILFENLPQATAPAQRITVTDALDASLDPRTFRLGEIVFGDHVIAVPSNRSFYQARIDLGAEHGGLLADVSAGLDVTSGKVVWSMTAIDPNTGERPEDPSLGLLPPNDETHRGEGHVSFTIKPKAGLATGTVINNQAVIVFDSNEPIVTNTVFNTIDSGAPASSVAALPAETEDPQFRVTWSGADDEGGSGIKDFTVYMSDNGGEYARWLEDTAETSADFTGVLGHRYRFFSVARDNVGNIEVIPDGPDAEILVRAPNQPPALAEIGNRNVAEGQSLSITVSASDPEEEPLIYEATGLPEGAAFDPQTRTFGWTPSFAQGGSYQVTFKVTDSGMPQLSDMETVTITVSNVNRPPVLSTIGSREIQEQQTLRILLAAEDPDAGDTLAYEALNLPAGAAFDPGTGVFAWTPSFTQSGSCQVTFKVTDNGVPPLSDSETVTITVENVNRPPVLSVIGDLTVNERQPLTIALAAEDPDVGDTLGYSVSSLPAGATIDDVGHSIVWTPTSAQVGRHEGIAVTVRDSGTPSLSDTEAFAITVMDVPDLEVVVAPSDGGTVTAEGIACPGDCSEAFPGASPVAHLKASPSSGHYFLRWEGDAFGVTDSFDLTLDGDKSVKAVFARANRSVCLSGCDHSTVQAAIDAAAPGDVIAVAPGTWKENVSVITSKEFTLVGGGSNATATVLNGDGDPGHAGGDGSAFSITAAEGVIVHVKLRNITMTGGAAWCGGGLLLEARGSGVIQAGIERVVITLNAAPIGAGGGICARALARGTLSLNLQNTMVTRNLSTEGGGIFANADGSGSTLALGMMNVTVGGNTAGKGSGIRMVAIAGGALKSTVVNSVVAGNYTTLGGEFSLEQGVGSMAEVTAAYSDIRSRTVVNAVFPWDSTMRSDTPVFCNPGKGDFHLNSDSPCIDRGTGAGAPGVDFEGTIRPQRTGIDMGADEYVPAVARKLTLTALKGGEVIPGGKPYDITWAAPRTLVQFKIYISTDAGKTWVLKASKAGLTRHITWTPPRPLKSVTTYRVKIEGYNKSKVRISTVMSARNFTVRR